jgi:hypothetical protein
MSNAMLVGLLLVAGIVVAFLLLRRKPGASARHTSHAATGGAATARESLLQIVIPESGACCSAAHQIETYRFNKHHAPSLPLPDCSMKNSCHCRYQPVPERRIGERRAGQEKRDTIRYEENPRRRGRGRRAQDKLFDRD